MSAIMVQKPKQTFKHTCGYCGESYSNSKEESRFCSFACLMSANHKKPRDEAYNTVKRTLAFIELPKSLRINGIPNYVYEQINKGEWPYKETPSYYHTRDKAMMALGFLACGRINEVLRVERSQFDFDSEKGFIIVSNFYVSKRKKATIEREGPTLVDIPIPTNTNALLYPFTELLQNYLDILEGERLFPFGEGRAWQIVKECTGLTYFANKIKNPIALAKIYGIKNVNTIMRYFKTQWTAYRDIYTLSAKR